MNYRELFNLASPEVIVVVTALAVLTIGLASKRAAGLCAGIASAGLLFAIADLILMPEKATLFHGMLVITPLSTLFKIICLILAFFTILLARGDHSLQNRGEYLALILLATIGLMLLVGSEELLMIFIGLELLGLSLYVLTAFDKSSVRSAEAGMKYFLFGSTASAFTLFGLSFIYGMTGMTGLAAIAGKISSQGASPLLAVGIIMTLVGFAFKIAAAPFHLWAPDAYEGAPIPSAAYIASASKVASFVVLGKIMLGAFAPNIGSAAWHAVVAGWAPIVGGPRGIFNLVRQFRRARAKKRASSARLFCRRARRLQFDGTRHWQSRRIFRDSVLQHDLRVHACWRVYVVALVRRETGGDDLQNFAGLRARSPLLAGCMAIFLLSLAGLPPLAGFFGKFYLFSAALPANNNNGLLWLVLVALFGSFVSLYYYLIVLKVIFVDQPSPSAISSVPSPVSQRLALVLLALVVILAGVAPQPLVARILAALS